jgi:hypothetical protein
MSIYIKLGKWIIDSWIKRSYLLLEYHLSGHDIQVITTTDNQNYL